MDQAVPKRCPHPQDNEPVASEASHIAPRPTLRRLHLELTNRCNSQCATCVRTTRAELDRDMSVLEVQEIVDALPQLESAALQVNGEPLLYPALAQVIRLLKERQISVELNTNAILLGDRLGKRLIDAGLDQLNISLDGMEAQTYQQLRGADRLERVVANTRSFMQLRGATPASPRVALWITISQHNINQLPALVDFAAKISVEEVYVQRLVFYGEGFARRQDALHGRLTSAQRALLGQAKDQAQRLGVCLRASGGYDLIDMLDASSTEEPWRGCRRPSESAVIMANGDVVPCCISTFVSPASDIRLGNLFESDLDTIWHGPAYRAMRESLKEGPGPHFCRGCGVKWSL